MVTKLLFSISLLTFSELREKVGFLSAGANPSVS